MKIGDVIHILTEFNKWRRGLPPYEWSEDPSTQNDLLYSTRDIGLAIDEALNMLRQAADMMEQEEKRERKFEYSQRRHDEKLGIDLVDMLHCSTLEGAIDLHGRFNKNGTIVRRAVGEWEEVPND